MMTDRPQISILDARLAEIDDRLRNIQDGLTDEAASSEPRPRPDAAGLRGIDQLLGELRSLVSTQERLLQSARELLRSHEQVRAASPDDPARLGLTVGPLRDPGELRAFESAVAALATVDAVELRGYEGGDRAVLDVQLRPTS